VHSWPVLTMPSDDKAAATSAEVASDIRMWAIAGTEIPAKAPRRPIYAMGLVLRASIERLCGYPGRLPSASVERRLLWLRALHVCHHS
jgi:hypothetical protein